MKELTAAFGQPIAENPTQGIIEVGFKGRVLANQSQGLHQLVVDFLLAIGVPRESAEIDAEGLEHHISKDTEKAFRSYLAKLLSALPSDKV